MIGWGQGLPYLIMIEKWNNMQFIIRYFKNAGARRVLMSLAGNLILGIGVAAFKFSGTGNDPFDGMNMAIAEFFAIYYPLLQVMVNVVLFIIQLIFARHLIGFGTIVNSLLIGYVANVAYNVMCAVAPKPEFVLFQIGVMIIGLILCSLGLSLYQTSDLGVAPYDALAITFDQHWKKVPYFWCRILCDATCALICFLFGGIVGIGTLVSAFGFGPVISFFNHAVSEPMLAKEK